MRRKFLNELKENEHIEDVFYVTEKMIGTGKTGKSYISLKVSDKTGILDAKIWDKVDSLNPAFDREDFVFLKGNVQMYLGNMQIVVNDIKKISSPEEVNIDDFIPESGKDVQQLWREFLKLGESIKDEFLRDLFKKIFIEDAGIQEHFRLFPAAKSLHHAYKGGLLEHSLNVAKLADMISFFYQGQLNRDLLVFSGCVHDIGKIKELSFSLAASYTDEGKLLGHIVLTDEILIRKAAEIKKFPEKTLTVLRHILLSHHGEYEFGSPKRPKTLEALAIHFLDNLDAKLNSFQLAVDKDMQAGDWTAIIKSFERQLYKGKIETEEAPGEIPAEGRVSKKKQFNPVLNNFNFELFKDKE